MTQQIKISDLNNLKEDALTSDDYLMVDNAVEGKTYKISKQSLFQLENFDQIVVEEIASPNKLVKTKGDTGRVSHKLLDIDVHSHHTEAFTAEPFSLYTLDSSLASFSVLLPLNPEEGTKIVFSDWAKRAGNNPITLIPNSPNKILNDNMLVLDVEGFGVTIVFSNNNWSIS